jgi:mannose/fructose/N-acetylgalactosamine-specific phosphotransferase system component IID
MVNTDVVIQLLASFTVTVYIPFESPLTELLVFVPLPTLQEYVYGTVPPDTFTDAVPLFSPLQVTFVCAVLLNPNTSGWVIVNTDVVVQVFASVTRTVYIPLESPLTELLVFVPPPTLQEYVYGTVPPDTFTDAVPLFSPLQVTFVCAVLLNPNTSGWVMVNTDVVIQLLASFTVTVYIPFESPLTELVVFVPLPTLQE